MKNTSIVDTERKLQDTELNIWLKSLLQEKKQIFYKNLWSNKLIWAPGTSEKKKKLMFNNYRYKGNGSPAHATKLLIYTTALTIEPKLPIHHIFPDIPQEYIEHLLPILLEFSESTNKHFHYVEN